MGGQGPLGVALTRLPSFPASHSGSAVLQVDASIFWPLFISSQQLRLLRQTFSYLRENHPSPSPVEIVLVGLWVIVALPFLGTLMAYDPGFPDLSGPPRGGHEIQASWPLCGL